MSDVLKNKGILGFIVFMFAISFISTCSFDTNGNYSESEKNYISIQQNI